MPTYLITTVMKVDAPNEAAARDMVQTDVSVIDGLFLFDQMPPPARRPPGRLVIDGDPVFREAEQAPDRSYLVVWVGIAVIAALVGWLVLP